MSYHLETDFHHRSQHFGVCKILCNSEDWRTMSPFCFCNTLVISYTFWSSSTGMQVLGTDFLLQHLPDVKDKPPPPRHKAQVLPLVVHLSLAKGIRPAQNQSNATAVNPKNRVLVCKMFPDSKCMIVRLPWGLRTIYGHYCRVCGLTRNSVLASSHSTIAAKGNESLLILGQIFMRMHL